MRLQRLEIAGYKSFGTRTELRFEAPLTAIIGPNGSGKSNVVDALRWVIGETANRNLRIRRIDDVIFSGGSSRPPAGLAEVRLSLDNSGRWLDLDAAEVEVARRVHRDGESEFRINGRSVRLRDVQDLFRAAGLSTDGYAMIGQGAVDEMLRMRPAERRRLIEEVADVRRHRRQMEDSRRQRARAAEHLERARLVQAELEPRLRGLARRAQRARQYESLAGRLAEALARYYRSQDAALRRELAGQRRAAAQAAAGREQAEERLAAMQAALGAAEQAVSEARRKHEIAAEARAKAERALTGLRGQQQIDERELEWRGRDRADAAAELESLGGPADDGDVRAAVQAAEAELADCDARLAEARASAHRAERAASAAAWAREELPGLRAELGGIVGARDGEAAEIADLEQAQRAAEEAIAVAEQLAEGARAGHARTAEALEEARRAERELAERRRSLAARLADAEQRAAELEADDAGTAEATLRSQLEVAPEWAAAVDAALGEAAFAEVLPSLEEALERAQEAVAADAGRVLAVAAGAGEADAAALDPRSAAHLAAAPDGLAGVAVALLGDVIVVDSVAEAVEAVDDGARVAVTREGIAVRADGVAAGGRGVPGARRRQEQAAGLRRSAAELAAELAGLPHEDELAERAADGELAHRQSGEAREAADARADQARRTAREVAERLSQSRAALRGRDADAERVAAHLRRAYEAIGDAAPDGGDPRAISELERRRDDASAALSAARLAMERADARRRVAERISDADARIAALRQAVEARSGEIARAESELEVIPAATELAAALTAAEAVQDHARNDLAEAQSARLDAERAAVEAESALREAQAARERLAEEAARDAIAIDPEPPDDVIEPEQLRREAQDLRERLQRLGGVDTGAAAEYEEERERLEALTAQIADLEAGEAKFGEAERELERVMRTRFDAAFRDVNEAFGRNFRVMFRGGSARLSLDQTGAEEDEAADVPEPGIVIDAQPPGKRLAGLSLLSGGERALTAIALLFALLEMRPAPFCVLDEVDAALDEANVERFIRAVKDRAGATQFVVITHNRRTIEQADAIYGVTMGEDALSRVISVRLSDAAADGGGPALDIPASNGNGARSAPHDAEIGEREPAIAD